MLMIWFNKPHDLTHFTPAYAFLVSNYRFNAAGYIFSQTYTDLSSGWLLFAASLIHLLNISQMLVGVVAFNTLRVIPPEDNRALGVLLVGYFFQGMLMNVATTFHIHLYLRAWIFHDLFLHLHLYHEVCLQ